MLILVQLVYAYTYRYIYVNTDHGLVVELFVLIVFNAINAGLSFGANIFIVGITGGEIWSDLETPFSRSF